MYFYHGYALGVGSTVKGQQFTEAVSALSVRGGTATASASTFTSNGISFQSARSQVSGEEQKSLGGLDVYVTKASVIIEKLNILNVMTADKVTGSVISEHKAGDYEANTVITGSFDGLEIQGSPITLQMSDGVRYKYPTFSGMQGAFQNGFSQDWVLKSLEGWGLKQNKPTDVTKDDLKVDDLRAVYEGYGTQARAASLSSAVLCSFVQSVSGLPGGVRNWGSIIDIPQFGRIYLGEVIVWPWMRCLTMFRVELSVGGSISGASAGSNGTTWPPGAYGDGGG